MLFGPIDWYDVYGKMDVPQGSLFRWVIRLMEHRPYHSWQVVFHCGFHA